MPVLQSTILAELDLIIKERYDLFAIQVQAGDLDKAEARTRYDALVRTKEIIIQYYKRIEEDMKLADELNRPEILSSMIQTNPSVQTLINKLNLKSI